ncbi:hypothetical protein SAMN05216269_11725 [Flavobacterium xinjiangense]|uniref:Uncharacterized protein n=1 Tax=Flavobacterium xinjiangense TaxID=178356 RepID=A0A1M7PGC2_9FLAO|nr:hypothetical protein SAMN05216269_11725 [Flavobacterium xinjiangense]
MYRKLILIPFSILLGMNILNYITNIFTELFTNYLLSLSALGLGTIFYPFDLKFKNKADYIFPSLLGYTIFSIANLFLFQDFSIKINYINILAGIFGVLLLFARKKKYFFSDQ